MPDDPVTGYIRVIAICVFRHGRRILVGDAWDPTKQQVFYRPPGGRVEFGETTEQALRREMREELGSEIIEPMLLGVLENLFTYDGAQGHEIVFVYDARLLDEARYDVDRFEAVESDGTPYNAFWLDLDAIGPQTPPVYPDGLVALIDASKPPSYPLVDQLARPAEAGWSVQGASGDDDAD